MVDPGRDEEPKSVESADLAEENFRLRTALEFYARATTNEFSFEKGSLARKTLEQKCRTPRNSSSAT